VATSSDSAASYRARVSRRHFLRRTGLGLAAAALLPAPAWSQSPAADPLSLAHLVLRPESPALETAVLEGGAMGAEEAAYNAGLFGTELTHAAFVADDPSGLLSAAQSAAEAPCVVAHLPDASAVVQALEATEDTGSLLLNTGAPTNDLRGADCHPRLFHVTASHAQRTDALIRWVGAREITSVTLLTGRADGAQATFVEAQLSDVGISVARKTESSDEAGEGAVWVVPDARPDAFGALAGDGRIVLAPHMVPEAHGVAHRPVLWHASLYKYGATQVSDRFAERAQQPMDGPAYVNWLAMQIAADAITQTGSSDPKALRTYFRTRTRFDGRKATPISFRAWSQQARHELYILTPDEENPIAGTVPAHTPDAPDARIEALDALGIAEGACSL